MPKPLPRFLPLTLRVCLLAGAVSLALAARPAGGQATAEPAAPQQPAAQALYEGAPILAVEVVGNTRTETRLILDQVRARAGQPYARALVDLDVRSISALDRFVVVRAEAQGVVTEGTGVLRGVIIRFIVTERDLVSAVELAGNRRVSAEDLRSGLTMRAGAAVDEFRIAGDIRYLTELYRQRGYSQVSVEVDRALLARQGILRYQIIEGPLSRIEQVEIEGNTVLSDAYIKWRIGTKPRFWILRKGLLDEELLQQDAAAIRNMYLRKGYLDARVSHTLDLSEDKSRITVRFVVIEGIQYRIDRINLEGHTVFAGSELLGDTTRFGPGSVAELDKIDALQKRIEDTYGHEGYINCNVEIVPAYTQTPGVVDLNIRIVEGQPFVVGRIIVRGNSNIQDRVVRRQVRIYPDQTFDMVLVRRSLDRLKASRVFSDAKITPITPAGNPPGVRDALVEVTEGQTGRFAFGAGVSTNSGVVGQVSIEQQNFDLLNFPRSLDEFLRGQSFKGAGQYFRLLLEPGTEFQRYRITFQEPYLLDSPYSLANDIFYFTRGRESWDERRFGDILTFGRRFSDVWGISLALRGEQVTLTNPQDFGNDGITQVNFPVTRPDGSVVLMNDTAQSLLDEEGSHFLTSIKPAIYRDTTDSQVFPTSGSRASLALEQYGALGGDIEMTKIVLTYNWYHTLRTDLFDRKTVLSLRNEVGLIPWGDSPSYERFYLGGIGELRGFRFRGVSPREGPLKDPIGGDFSWVTTVEVNYPIWENFLRGVVFVDVGTVESDITISSIRSDVGAGLRLSLPLLGGLPIAVDLAYPLTKKDGDRTQLISVSLGLPF